jgi:carboxypeptidase family protein
MRIEQDRNAGSALADLPVLSSRAKRALLCVVTLLPAVIVWGCSGVVSGQNSAATQPPPQTYSISGTIGPVTGGSGASVTLSGAANATTTANSSGNFTFTGLANGTYTVTPSHAGYTFNPSSLNITVSGANITTGLSFTATSLTFSVSGTISPSAGGSGATVALSGIAAATTTADGAGNYSFTGLANGTYAVTPNRTGYTFSPGAQIATVSGANVTGINFTATANVGPTFSISGTISPTTGGSGATVILGGAAGATTLTNSSGNYGFSGLTNGTYVITPTNTGYAFSPATQSVTVSGANLTGVNFTATAQQVHTVALTWSASTSTVAGYNVYRSTISGTGYAKINSSPVAVLNFTDSTVLNGTTYYYVTTAVDSSNNESTYSNQVSAAIP